MQRPYRKTRDSQCSGSPARKTRDSQWPGSYRKQETVSGSRAENQRQSVRWVARYYERRKEQQVTCQAETRESESPTYNVNLKGVLFFCEDSLPLLLASFSTILVPSLVLLPLLSFFYVPAVTWYSNLVTFSTGGEGWDTVSLVDWKM